MQPIKTLKYGKESPYVKKFQDVKTDMFEDGWQKIELQEPPSNDSKQVVAELEELKSRIKNNTRQKLKEIHREDSRAHPFELLFADLVKKDDIKVKRFVSDLADQIFKIIIFFKNKYDRPRPFQVAKHLGIDFNPIISETADSPSYPSGHAFAASLLAGILSQKYPKKKAELYKLADRIAENRLNAGVHFPSDVTAGRILAEMILPYYKKNSKLHFKEWFS